MATLPLEEALQLRDPTPEAMRICAEILASENADPWDVAEVFEKLREWLRRDVEHAQRLLANANLQLIIVTAIKRHGRNMEVARYACGVVAGCCQKSSLQIDLMLKAGIVSELLFLMDVHHSDGTLQDNACVALWRISQRHGGAAETVVKMGGLEKLFRAMRDHLANPFVQVNACMAFERLYMKGGASPEGMKEAALKAMEAHPSNTQIKRGASRLLEVLDTPLPTQMYQPTRVASSKWRQPSGKKEIPPGRTDIRDVAIHDWLLELDSIGFLMEYHGDLKRNFKSLAQIVEAYAPSGELDPKFFADIRVLKLGHQRLFQKWCRDNLLQQNLACI